MKDRLSFFVGGRWIDPVALHPMEVTNPATEAVIGRISLAQRADVDRAVAAAKDAFRDYSRVSLADRRALLQRILALYQARYEEIAQTISAEMGAPIGFARAAQAATGVAHLQTAIAALETYRASWSTPGGARVDGLPIGVCGLITPWNWPINQVACKVVPALAMGCTMVLKPSEQSPYSAMLLAEILAEAGTPPGVFNLINGDAAAGAALAAHPDVDMISFTGSTRAGVEVAISAAPTVKRVHQELGGKSPNIILDDADLGAAIAGGVIGVMLNSGQSCNAPTRMLVPKARMAEAVELARASAEAVTVGDPTTEVTIGPVVSAAQWARVQRFIETGIEEGATLVSGGPGCPPGLNKGYYVRPTVFADVTNDMTIAREEIFGPVLCMLAYDTEEEAVEIANDSPYGLAAYVQGSPERAARVAAELRAGQVLVNGAALDFSAPFGGLRRSGNGREWGEAAFGEFLELRATVGV